MNSRERVLAALEHRQPDKVPIDLSGHRSSGIAAMAYRKLRRHLQLPEKPIRIYDVVQQLAVVDDDVLERFQVDTIELGRGFSLKDEDWHEWVLPDGTPCYVPIWTNIEREPDRWVIRSGDGEILAHMPDGAIYFEQVYYPFAEKDDIDRLEEIFGNTMWTGIAAPPGPVDDDQLKTGARQLRATTDKAIIGLFGGNLFETGHFFYRNDNFMMLMAAEPDKTNRFLDKLMEMHLAKLEKYLAAVGDSIDIILFGDDLGMQSGPMMSPAMYRDMFKPRHKILWNRAKELADVKVMLHCCGGVRELFPDLIDAGLDAINPVQISCCGMDAVQLKADFGNDITFWGGGCDTRGILPESDPADITEHVRRQVEILHPGGGFVFQQVHNILANVPPANIVAMFDAVRP